MNISVVDLKVLLLFAAKRDIRYYLNCIYIKGSRMYATDGHRLAACQLDSDSGLDILVPSEDIALAIKFSDVGETIEITDERIGRVVYTPVDCKFPDVTKVVPEDVEKIDAQRLSFNPNYLATMAKVTKLLGCGYGNVRITAKNDESVAILEVDDPRFFFLVMPMRDDKKRVLIPDWVKGGA